MRQFFILVLSLLIPCAAFCQITTETSFVYFSPDAPPVKNIAVFNSHTEDTVLVEVEATKINAEKDENGKDLPTNDIIVSPRRFTMPPSTSRVARIILRTPPGENEAAYRVNFIPRAVTDDEGKIPVNAHGRGVKLRILTGVGALIFAEPKNPQAVMQWEDQGSKFTVTNTGNSNVYFDDVNACSDPEDSNSCIWIKEASKRLYPGMIHTFNKPAGKLIKATRRVNDDSKTVVLKTSGSETIPFIE